MNPAAVNYQPLETMDHAWLTVMNRTWKGSLWVLGVLSVAAAMLVPYFGFFLLFLYLVLIVWLTNKYKEKIWEQFATVNGWKFDASIGPNLITPSLNFGHSHHFSSVIQAQLGDIICDLLSYTCSTGEGRSQTTHYFTIAVTRLPKPMPHMLLSSKKDNADIKNDVMNAENLKLEGDFDNYFKLQVEKGQEIDALTIITPDVMQTLISYNQAEDLETLGENLYFIVKGDKRSPGQVKQLLQSVLELNAQLYENARLSAISYT